MDDAAHRQWLKDFGAYVSSRDAEGVASLFGETCAFHIDPFEAPLRSRADVAQEFTHQLGERRDVSFAATMVCVAESTGWSHWTCNFTRNGLDDPVRQEGVLKFVLDDARECVEFRQWWHSIEPGQGDLMRDFDA